MIFHPRVYKDLRDLAVLRLELGDRAFRQLVPDSWMIAIPALFRELAW